MEKLDDEINCRICLSPRRNLRSVFETANSTTYVEMITSISRVKISDGDGHSHKICSSCSIKLRDAYEFKCLIERSDWKLNNGDNKYKKINFNSLDDIKIEMECFKIEPNSLQQIESKNEQVTLNLQSDDITQYKDTIIKRVNNKNEKVESDCQQTLSVEDLLNTVKDEIHVNGDTYDDYESCDDLDEYIPPYLKKKKHTKKAYNRNTQKCGNKAKLKTNKSEVSNGTKLNIKPVVINDLRLMSTKPLKQKSKTKPKKKSYKKETVCPHCGRLTKNLKSHMLIHTGEKSFKCKECPKAFYKSIQLQYHMVEHTNVKEYKCEKCVAAFYYKGHLRNHMLSHLDLRKYVCDVCSKSFKRKFTMDQHKLRHSSANKTVNCELCNMSFFDKLQLNNHMRVHTGERPYNCQLCSQPYSYKHDFNRHCLKKHGVFLKRRSVNVMNEEVLAQERALMREVFMSAQGVLVDGKPLNPFKGPRAAMAYEVALKALKARQVTLLDV